MSRTAILWFRYGNPTIPATGRSTVHAVGFDVARNGETAIREAFDGIAAASTGYRFVTMSSLSEETGYHRNTLKSLFAACRVTRFTAGGQDVGPLCLRSEAAKALK